MKITTKEYIKEYLGIEDLQTIKEEVNIPVKYVGLGEGANQIEAFDIEKYIYGLFKDL